MSVQSQVSLEKIDRLILRVIDIIPYPSYVSFLGYFLELEDVNNPGDKYRYNASKEFIQDLEKGDTLEVIYHTSIWRKFFSSDSIERYVNGKTKPMQIKSITKFQQ
jgi:hypothetical protein